MSSQEKTMGTGKVLYMLNVPNVEIARTLGVSETTVSNWVTKGDWRTERLESVNSRKARMDMMGDLIDFQLEALHQRVQASRDYAIDKGDGMLMPIDKGEVDALVKMFATIKGKELTFAMLVTVIRELIEFLNQKKPDLAKDLIPFTNDFLLGKKEVLTA